MKQWVVGVAVLVIGVGGNWQPDVCAAILINEVLADPADDANGDGSVHTTRDEFVELVNTEAADVSLANWTLSDALQVRHTFQADSVILSRGFFIVFGGGAPQGFSHAATASTGGLALNNAGDTVSLHDAAMLLADSLMFGSEGGHDVSLTRSPDGAGSFVQHTTVSIVAFSPGATIDGIAHLPFPELEPAPPASDSQPEPQPDPAPLPLPEPDPVQDPGPGPELPPIPLPGDDVPDLPSGPVVPEPASLILFGAGMAWLRYNGRRNEKGALGFRHPNRPGHRWGGDLHCDI